MSDSVSEKQVRGKPSQEARIERKWAAFFSDVKKLEATLVKAYPKLFNTQEKKESLRLILSIYYLKYNRDKDAILNVFQKNLKKGRFPPLETLWKRNVWRQALTKFVNGRLSHSDLFLIAANITKQVPPSQNLLDRFFRTPKQKKSEKNKPALSTRTTAQTKRKRKPVSQSSERKEKGLNPEPPVEQRKTKPKRNRKRQTQTQSPLMLTLDQIAKKHNLNPELWLHVKAWVSKLSPKEQKMFINIAEHLWKKCGDDGCLTNDPATHLLGVAVDVDFIYKFYKYSKGEDKTEKGKDLPAVFRDYFNGTVFLTKEEFTSLLLVVAYLTHVQRGYNNELALKTASEYVNNALLEKVVPTINVTSSSGPGMRLMISQNPNVSIFYTLNESAQLTNLGLSLPLSAQAGIQYPGNPLNPLSLSTYLGTNQMGVQFLFEKRGASLKAAVLPTLPLGGVFSIAYNPQSKELILSMFNMPLAYYDMKGTIGALSDVELLQGFALIMAISAVQLYPSILKEWATYVEGASKTKSIASYTGEMFKALPLSALFSFGQVSSYTINSTFSLLSKMPITGYPLRLISGEAINYSYKASEPLPPKEIEKRLLFIFKYIREGDWDSVEKVVNDTLQHPLSEDKRILFQTWGLWAKVLREAGVSKNTFTLFADVLRYIVKGKKVGEDKARKISNVWKKVIEIGKRYRKTIFIKDIVKKLHKAIQGYRTASSDEERKSYLASIAKYMAEISMAFPPSQGANATNVFVKYSLKGVNLGDVMGELTRGEKILSGWLYSDKTLALRNSLLPYIAKNNFNAIYKNEDLSLLYNAIFTVGLYNNRVAGDTRLSEYGLLSLSVGDTPITWNTFQKLFTIYATLQPLFESKAKFESLLLNLGFTHLFGGYTPEMLKKLSTSLPKKLAKLSNEELYILLLPLYTIFSGTNLNEFNEKNFKDFGERIKDVVQRYIKAYKSNDKEAMKKAREDLTILFSYPAAVGFVLPLLKEGQRAMTSAFDRAFLNVFSVEKASPYYIDNLWELFGKGVKLWARRFYKPRGLAGLTDESIYSYYKFSTPLFPAAPIDLLTVRKKGTSLIAAFLQSQITSALSLSMMYLSACGGSNSCLKERLEALYKLSRSRGRGLTQYKKITAEANILRMYFSYIYDTIATLEKTRQLIQFIQPFYTLGLLDAKSKATYDKILDEFANTLLIDRQGQFYLFGLIKLEELPSNPLERALYIINAAERVLGTGELLDEILGKKSALSSINEDISSYMRDQIWELRRAVNKSDWESADQILERLEELSKNDGVSGTALGFLKQTFQENHQYPSIYVGSNTNPHPSLKDDLIKLVEHLSRYKRELEESSQKERGKKRGETKNKIKHLKETISTLKEILSTFGYKTK